MFTCPERCLSDGHVCDGFYDCLDNRDEMNCGTLYTSPIINNNICVCICVHNFYFYLLHVCVFVTLCRLELWSRSVHVYKWILYWTA